MIVSLDVAGSGSVTQDLFIFSEYTVCEVSIESSCRSTEAFVVDCVAALPSCESSFLSLWPSPPALSCFSKVLYRLSEATKRSHGFTH